MRLEREKNPLSEEELAEKARKEAELVASLKVPVRNAEGKSAKDLEAEKKRAEDEKKMEEFMARQREERARRRTIREARLKLTAKIAGITLAAAILLWLLVGKLIIPAIYYGRAEEHLKNGELLEAAEAFTLSGNYRNAEERAPETYYRLGEALLTDQDYDGASRAFKNAKAFKNARIFENAQIMFLESLYQKAEALTEAGAYDEASVIYASLSGYRKADTILADSEELTAALQAYLADCDIGQTVTFGRFGGEDIDWLILDAKDNTRTVISVKGQECMHFNVKAPEGNKWKNSHVRRWLNREFYREAFTEEEKETIIPGGEMNDNIWLLAADEANQYFEWARNRTCAPTQHAIENGVVPNEDGFCRWWLRTEGTDSNFVTAFVAANGMVFQKGRDVDLEDCLVRPVTIIEIWPTYVIPENVSDFFNE